VRCSAVVQVVVVLPDEYVRVYEVDFDPFPELADV